MADTDDDFDVTFEYGSDYSSDIDSSHFGDSLDSFLVSDASADFSDVIEFVGMDMQSTLDIEEVAVNEEPETDDSDPDSQNTVSSDGSDIDSVQTVETNEISIDRSDRPDVVLNVSTSHSNTEEDVPDVIEEHTAERATVSVNVVDENNSSARNNSNNDEVVFVDIKLPSSCSSSKSQGEKRPLEDSYVDDGVTCSICLDSFTNSGPHRLSSLRCGHLFGLSCVERWLKVGCNAGARRCPTCNKKATVKDIRVLYAKKLVAIDTSELDKFKEELNKALMNKNVLNLEIEVCKMNQDMLKKELETLRKELEVARRKAASIPDGWNQSGNSSQTSLYKLKFAKELDVCNAGGCRVMAFDRHINLVVSTTQSKNNLFPGFGFKTFDVLEFRSSNMIPLHPKMIRDFEFNKVHKDILLSVSLDCTAKLLDLRCNTGLNTFTAPSPLWACCWDANNSNLFYIGAQSGTISQYDTRKVYNAVHTLVPVKDRTPIVSLASVPATSDSPAGQTGFLCCRLNSMSAYEQESVEKWKEPRFLSTPGPFMSMSYDEGSHLLLTTARPNNKCDHTRHDLNQISGDFRSFDLIHSIAGGATSSLLSRSCFVKPSVDHSYVAAYNESTLNLELFNTADGLMSWSVYVGENVIDVCPVSVNGSCILTGLSDKKLRVYNFESDNAFKL